MRLTTFTDYSLRVLIYVATAPEGRGTIAEVAKAFAISENHLVKVVHLLGREGLLFNTRGRGGGFRLAAPPREINIGRVVRLTEGGDIPAECFDRAHDTCAISKVCRLAGVLDQAVKAFYKVLDGFTLEDLIQNRRELSAIMHRFPSAAAA
jgi:Rrf2 family transcriptional regulator, nitric oxide-sensitive transcriptional repressor